MRMRHLGSRRAVLNGALAALLLGGAGCTDLGAVRGAATTAGTPLQFSAPYDRVTAATLRALQSLNVGIASSQENAEGMMILVSKAIDTMSWGEVGRIMVFRTAGPITTVRVYWEKRYRLQLTGTNEAEFIGALYPRIASALQAAGTQ